MVPSTGLSVLFFLALVTPGLVFDLLWETRRARPTESTFREVSRVALASFVLTAVAFAALGLINAGVTAVAGGWRVLPDLAEWIRNGSAYLADHFVLVAISLGLQTSIASVLAWATFKVLTRNQPARLSQVSAWHQAFRARNPTTAAPRARVRLKNGSVFVGLLGDYTATLAPPADRELVLYPPLRSRTGANKLAEVPQEWHCIVISGSEVETIAVRYREPNPGEPEIWDAVPESG